MTFSFHCPLCGKKLTASPDTVGKERACPKCRARIRVPSEQEAARRKHVEPEHEASTHTALLGASGTPHEEDLIDMTAMVDIVFFLLIFFMVTSITALESVIGLPTPQSSAPSAATQVAADLANDPSFVAVTIEADDTVWVEDEQVFGSQSLRVALRDVGDRDFQPTGMMVTGHPDASHGTLVMVLDAGADAGLQDLRFSVSESPADIGG
jgi:biopolymer transport protein ExbD